MPTERNTDLTPAAEYLRVSTSRQVSEPVQHEHNIREAERLGWRIVATYTDHGESAFSGKRERKAWERMLADAQTGRFAAVIAHDDDRLWRDYSEQAAVFVALAQAGVRWVHTTRTYSTDSDDDRGLSAMQSVFGWMQSAKTRRKVRDTLDANVAAGKPHGGVRPFGYRRVHRDREQGVDAGLTVDEAEAAEIRDAYRRVLRGESLRSIAADWRQRVPTVSGGMWRPFSVRRALTAPRIAGLRESKGEIVGDAAWPAIVDRADWERVCAVLLADDRGGPDRRLPRRWVLRGLAYCGRCGTRLITRLVAGGGGVADYICPLRSEGGCGRLGVRAPAADDEVGKRFVAAFAGPGSRLAATLRSVSADVDAAKIAGQLHGDRKRLDRLTVEYTVEQIHTKGGFLQAKRELEQKIAAAELSLGRSREATLLASLPAETIGRLWGWWQSAPVDVRHETLRAAVKDPEVDGLPAGIVVLPAKPGNRFDPNRIRVHWRA